jgi:hypothetical protein
VKPETPCKFLWHVKELYECERNISYTKIYHFLSLDPPDLLLDDSAGRIARELWWTN